MMMNVSSNDVFVKRESVPDISFFRWNLIHSWESVKFPSLPVATDMGVTWLGEHFQSQSYWCSSWDIMKTQSCLCSLNLQWIERSEVAVAEGLALLEEIFRAVESDVNQKSVRKSDDLFIVFILPLSSVISTLCVLDDLVHDTISYTRSTFLSE